MEELPEADVVMPLGIGGLETDPVVHCLNEGPLVLLQLCHRHKGSSPTLSSAGKKS